MLLREELCFFIKDESFNAQIDHRAFQIGRRDAAKKNFITEYLQIGSLLCSSAAA
jgi:hypothetical protein